LVQTQPNRRRKKGERTNRTNRTSKNGTEWDGTDHKKEDRYFILDPPVRKIGHYKKGTPKKREKTDKIRHHKKREMQHNATPKKGAKSTSLLQT